MKSPLSRKNRNEGDYMENMLGAVEYLLAGMIE
jgi:hypothetical protein